VRDADRPDRPADLLGHLVPRGAAAARPTGRRPDLQREQLGVDPAAAVRRERPPDGRLPHDDRRARQQRLHRRGRPGRRGARREVPRLLAGGRDERLAGRGGRERGGRADPPRRRRPRHRAQRPRVERAQRPAARPAHRPLRRAARLPRRIGVPPVSGVQAVAWTARPVGPWAVAAVGAAVVVAAVWGIPLAPADSPGFAAWLGSYDRVPSFLTWVLADATDAQFHRSALGAALMLAGAGVAHRAYRRGRRWRGFDVGCGSGLWPWLTASALLGVLAAHLLWGWVVPVTGSWQPLFVAFVSVAPAVVLCYGPGWPVALTGAALGAGVATPIALLVHNAVCVPLGLSSLVAATTGMWAGGLAG